MKSALILIVDDSSTTQVICKDLFEASGYKTIAALNGKEALKILEQVTPDLILLDLMMPGMSGQDVLKVIKDNPKWKNIPIVVQTAMDVDEKTSSFIKEKATHVLPKPIDIDILLNTIENSLAK